MNYLAQTINLQPGGQFGNIQNLSFAGIIAAAIKMVLVIAALVFFFILVIGGVKWILSEGDKNKTEAARNQITQALIGLVVVFAAWAISQLIGTFFGVNIFQLEIPTIK